MTLDPSAIDWARAQFALTAIYHWLFVPLTLGLGIIMAIMVEFYAILCLLATFLMLNGLPYEALTM